MDPACKSRTPAIKNVVHCWSWVIVHGVHYIILFISVYIWIFYNKKLLKSTLKRPKKKKVDMNKWKDITCSWKRWLYINITKISILPNKNTNNFLPELQRLNLKFIRKINNQEYLAKPRKRRTAEEES